ncbi:MAG: OsmC family protein [Thermoanaerobaculia bacterium]
MTRDTNPTRTTSATSATGSTSADRHEHRYRAHLTWEGNHGDGTADYATYGREHVVRIDGEPDLGGSADPAFRGDPSRHNPEDLLLAALSACHMLSYLALCARIRIVVTAYEDRAVGTMREDGKGGGRFVEVVLRPVVTIADEGKRAKAETLHARAHELCFIAASCNFPVRHEAAVQVEVAVRE